MAVLGLVFACLANLLQVRRAEQQVANKIKNAGGYNGYTLLGVVPRDDSDRWQNGPEFLQRVVFVRLSGTEVNDEELTKLDLQRLKHLRGLTIGYDAVFGIDGPKWQGLPPPITDRGLRTLPPIPTLRHLSLWDLSVGDSGLRGVAERYPLLEYLNLQGTRVSDLTLAEIGQLRELQHLELQDTLVTDSGLRHLANLQQLKVLHLSDTCILGSGLVHVSRLTELASLDLRNTQVSDEHLRHLARLHRLHSLSLESTEVGADGIRHLEGLNDLKYLNLNETSVTDAAAEHLARIPKLREVGLYRTHLTDTGLAEFAETPNLKFVSLNGTNVSMSGVEYFLRRAPNRCVAYNNRVLYVTDLKDDR